MASEALEQMLGDVRGFEQSIDTYAAGTIALYTGRPMHTPNGFGMPGMMGPGPICDRRDDFEQQQSFSILHPNKNDELGESVHRTSAYDGAGDRIDKYNNSMVNVHQIGEYNEQCGRPSNIHIDLGVNHLIKLNVERQYGSNSTMKDLYPLFER